MFKPQKYVRNSGLRSYDFREECEGVPTWFEIFSCVILAGCVALVLSVVLA